MKQTILSLILSVLIALNFTNCTNSADCPLCHAKGILEATDGVITCFVCNGDKKITKENAEKVREFLDNYAKGVYNTAQNYETHTGHPHQSSDGVICPICKGSRMASNGNTCYYCNGVGYVNAESAAMMQHIINGGSTSGIFGTPGSNSGNGGGSGSSDLDCVACHGTGQCQHCKGLGVTSYNGQYGMSGGVDKCPICKNSKKCQVCRGSGRKG